MTSRFGGGSNPNNPFQKRQQVINEQTKVVHTDRTPYQKEKQKKDTTTRPYYLYRV